MWKLCPCYIRIKHRGDMGDTGPSWLHIHEWHSLSSLLLGLWRIDHDHYDQKSLATAKGLYPAAAPCSFSAENMKVNLRHCTPVPKYWTPCICCQEKEGSNLFFPRNFKSLGAAEKLIFCSDNQLPKCKLIHQEFSSFHKQLLIF